MARGQDRDTDVDRFAQPKLLSDLKRRTIRGGAAVLAAQGVAFLLQLCTTVILARLLTPADFGLVAMVTAVMGFATGFKDLGLSMATVQRSHITNEQVSTLFWINVGLSVVLALGTAALAPVVSWFYGEPKLTALTQALAVTFAFGGLAVQHTALLRRQMRLGALAATQLLSSFIGALTGIALALLGAGYWSLVAMTASTLFCNACAVWVASGWVPIKPDRRSNIGSLLRFGGHLAAFNVMNYVSTNADKVLIGWALGARALGLYSKAYGLLLLPIVQINGPASSAAIPALSRLQSEPDRFRHFYRGGVELIAACGKPIAIFLIVTAEETVRTVLGEQWLEVVPIFRALGFLMFMTTTNVAVGWVHVSLGRPDRQLRWALLATPIRVLAVIFSLRWGAIGVGVALCIVRATLYIPALWYAFKGSSVTVWDFFSAISRPSIASAVSGVILYECQAYLRSVVADRTVILVACEAVVYVALYLLALAVLPGGRVFIRRTIGLMRTYLWPKGQGASPVGMADGDV